MKKHKIIGECFIGEHAGEATEVICSFLEQRLNQKMAPKIFKYNLDKYLDEQDEESIELLLKNTTIDSKTMGIEELSWVDAVDEGLDGLTELYTQAYNENNNINLEFIPYDNNAFASVLLMKEITNIL